MTRTRFRAAVVVLLVSGLLLRYWLAFHIFRAQGFAWDLSTFADWMETIRSSGHSAYLQDPSINYPPVFAQLLELLNWCGMHLPGSNSPEIGDGPWLLLKWLPILADLGIAALLAYAGRRWFTASAALWAAGLYLFIPITWYDSAIWGQMDSVAALPVLAALVLLAAGRPELAACSFIAAVLTKPQAALAVLVLLPAVIGLVRVGRLAWTRLLTTTVAAVLAFVALVNTWSLRVYVDGGWSGVPVLHNMIGLARQYFATSDLFPYLSVNAFNPWALVGRPALAEQFQTQDVTWVSDAFQIAGVSAHTLGIALFLAATALAAFLVLRRPDVLSIFLAAAIVFTAFFTLTTRVHERYLVQLFSVLALVWARRWWQRVALLVLAFCNTMNLHAILVGGLRIGVDTLGKDMPQSPYPHQGMPPEFYGFSWPSLPVLHSVSYGVVLASIVAVCLSLLILCVQAFRMAANAPGSAWSQKSEVA